MILSLLVSAALGGAAPAAVGDLPASPAEMASAATDCTKAVSPGKVKVAALKELGWQSGGTQKRTLGSIPLEEYLFGKPGGNVVNVVQITGGISATCMTIGRLRTEAEAAELRDALIATGGVQPLDAYKGDEAFKATMLRASPKAREQILIGDARRFNLMSEVKDGMLIVKVMMLPKRSPR
jgi:hypothetical protein